MMTKKQLDGLIVSAKFEAEKEKKTRDIFVVGNPTYQHHDSILRKQVRLIKLLESIRDTQTTADGKIALRGDEVWLGDDFGGVFSERVYVSSDCTDKQISTTYSSEAALKRAMRKARRK